MAIDKLTGNVKPLDEVDKINEIIDELDNIDPLPSQTGQSGKYLTTNGTVPSWAEVQSLPSQTGKAGKFLQTDGTDASWESAPFRNIGEIVASTIPLTDAGLHLLDGALIQGDGIYSAFVTYIAGLVSTYPNLFVTESAWQSAVTTYGVCGKFVYDSTNNTIRLPKITGIIEGTTDLSALGDLVEAGLPNHTHTITLNTKWGNNNNNNGPNWCGDDATRAINVPATSSGASNPIYGNSNTVQPQTIKCYYYIVIATSTKTDIQVDIDEIATDLNGKADVDLTNVANTAGFRKLVEVYNNGTSWYKVFREYNPQDGSYIGLWCEQGGSGSSGTITFLKHFSDANYTVTTRMLSGSGNVSWVEYGENTNKTTTTFKAGTRPVSWQASGYIN